jgi:hypothetical protein
MQAMQAMRSSQHMKFGDFHVAEANCIIFKP